MTDDTDIDFKGSRNSYCPCAITEKGRGWLSEKGIVEGASLNNSELIRTRSAASAADLVTTVNGHHYKDGYTVPKPPYYDRHPGGRQAFFAMLDEHRRQFEQEKARNSAIANLVHYPDKWAALLPEVGQPILDEAARIASLEGEIAELARLMTSKERQIAEARETFLKKIKRKWKAAAIQDARVQYAEERMRPKAAE